MTDDPIAPHLISDETEQIHLDGHLVPFDELGRPALFGMPGTADRFIALFSNQAVLDTFYKDYQEEGHFDPPDRIVTITDSKEFFDSIRDSLLTAEHPLPFRVRFAIDLHKHENGRVRFREVIIPPGQAGRMS